MNPLLDALDQVDHPHLLVLGDLMLDRYTRGHAGRLSPEAPVLVLEVQDREVRPGGAASVAALLRGLGAEVTLAGVLGDDEDGHILSELLAEAGVDQQAMLYDGERPTTTKERLLAQSSTPHPQPLLRIDREWRQPLRPDLEERLLRLVSSHFHEFDAVLISDYAKGVCSPSLLHRLLAQARRHELPILIDPARGIDFGRYADIDLLTPNRLEAELATGSPILSPADAVAAGQRLCRDHGVAAVLIKLDRDGLVLVEARDSSRAWPAWTRSARDVTGAGDMVLAMAGLCRAAGLGWGLAAALANVAAGLEVVKNGVAVVRRAEVRAALAADGSRSDDKVLTVADLALLAAAYRERGSTMVFSNGCFDLLHPGHICCLEEAATLGDVLAVAINTDASVRRLKGPGRPVRSQAERAALVAALGCVDHVCIFDGDTPHELLRQVRPDVLVKGGTYRVEEVVGREVVEGYGGRVHVTGRLAGVSTTTLLAALRDPAVPIVSPCGVANNER